MIHTTHWFSGFLHSCNSMWYGAVPLLLKLGKAESDVRSSDVCSGDPSGLKYAASHFEFLSIIT